MRMFESNLLRLGSVLAATTALAAVMLVGD
jgi:hypothetical protein